MAMQRTLVIKEGCVYVGCNGTHKQVVSIVDDKVKWKMVGRIKGRKEGGCGLSGFKASVLREAEPEEIK